MIDGNRIVAVVPARAGSKSVPGKNLRLLAGRPLVAWPIETAQAVQEIDRIIVSTDGQAIAEAAKAHGAEVIERPAHLATDGAIVADVLRHVVEELRAEGETARYLVLLEPTAPYRLPEDILSCLRTLHDQQYDSVATFAEAELNPFRAWRIEDGVPSTFVHGTDPWKPRQQLPKAYQLTGSVYAFVIDRFPPDTPSLLFGRHGAVILDQSRLLDLDTEFDFVVANAILKSDFVTQS